MKTEGKVGRPPITNIISPEKMLKAYEVSGSVRAAARKLGTTHRTVSKYLKEMGVSVEKPKDWVYTERKRPTRYSKFAKWLYENSGVKLPRSLAELARMSGCTYQTVNCYMYRRRKAVKDILDGCPDLIEAGVLVSVDNMPGAESAKKKPVINTRRFKKYRFEVDGYTLDAKLVFDTDKYRGLVSSIPKPSAFVKYVVDHYIIDG